MGVKIRFRETSTNKTDLVNINRATYATLRPRTDKTRLKITASITRLNINTGNGRLLIKGEAETVAFGFPAQKKYRELQLTAKQKFSDNLHTNNGKPNEEWLTLELVAHAQKQIVEK